MKGQWYFGFGIALIVFVLGMLALTSFGLKEQERFLGLMAMVIISAMIMVLSFRSWQSSLR